MGVESGKASEEGEAVFKQGEQFLEKEDEEAPEEEVLGEEALEGKIFPN